MKKFPAFLLVLAAGCALSSAADSRPNVLFLFADDQRADTVAALGNPVIQTPALDRLVHSGVAFDRAYMQGGMNGATCVPSRAMLLSGRTLFHIHEKLQQDGTFDDTWPAAFGRAGYTTFMTGKWHNGPEAIPHSFQFARSVFAGGMGNPLKLPVQDMVDSQLAPARVAAHHSCAVFADEVIDFIHHHKAGPFFAYVAFDAPHDPHIVPPDFSPNYDPAAIPLPASFLPQHPWDNGDMTVRDERLLPWPRTPDRVKAYLAEYYRYVTYLDSQIGRILDALAASPDATNTVVVFSADSGVACGSHGLLGKQNLYEYDSVRVPLLISGPGISAGKRTAAMCYLFDVLPTLGNLCHVPPPSDSDGISFAGTLRDSTTPARSEMLFAYKNVQRAYRDEQWKLIRYPQVNQTQLFNLQSDPEEATNLATLPQYAGRVARLTAKMRQAQHLFADTLPLTLDHPKPAAWTPPPPGQRQNAPKSSD
jgi:arylsulfatase A-like enzyme